MHEPSSELQVGAAPAGTLIKTDTGGRIRYDEAFRQRVLQGYAASGMSAAAFARHCGVKYSTLAAWVRKGLPERSAAPGELSPGARFVVAHAASQPDDGAMLEVELAAGMVARARDHAGVQLLASLVDALLRKGGATC